MIASLLKKAFGKEGGVTYAELEEETYRHKFSEFLPYIAYDDETNVYVNVDDTVGFIWECVPLILAGEQTEFTLEGLFRIGLPERSVVQFILFADPHIDPILKSYLATKVRQNEVTKLASEKYVDFLRQASKNGLQKMSGIPTRHYRLFVTLKVPLKEGKLQCNIEDIKKSFTEILRGANLSPHLVSAKELLDFLRRILNDDIPSEFYGKYDETIPIRKQIILDTYIKKYFDRLEIGKKEFRCMTPKSFPTEVDSFQTNNIFGGIWGVTSDATQIQTPYLYCLNIIFDNIKGMLHAKCNLILSQQAVGSFAPSLMRKKEEYLKATDDLERGIPFVRAMPILWVFDENKSKVVDALKRARRVWESAGYVTQEDKGILPILLISSLPFGLYNVKHNIQQIDRDFIVPSHTLTSILPVQGDFVGGGQPQLILTSRKGQVAMLDLFFKGANNNNLFVVASSGAGKSFFVNFIIANYYASNALVRIIDIGGSYKKMTTMFNARYLDFTPDSNICLNPFTNLEEEDLDKHLSTISSIVIQMAYANTDTIPEDRAEIIYNLVQEAVKYTYKKYGKENNIDNIVEYLKSYPMIDGKLVNSDSPFISQLTETAHLLAFNLINFTTKGPYGRWFNGRSNFDISKDEMVVLELEHLKPQKELFKVVTLLVINAVTQDLYLSDRSRRRFIIFDEAWQFLSGSSIMKNVIEEGYRRARKYGGSFTIITQTLLDLKSFGAIGDVIKANSAFKFYLESPDFEKAKIEKIIDYDDFIIQLLKTVKSNKPYYSEIFVDTPFGIGITRLVVDDHSYYVFTSDAAETAEIEKMVKEEGLTYTEAIERMIEKYRRRNE